MECPSPRTLRGLEAPPGLTSEEQLNLMAENAVVIAAALLKQMSRCINFTGGISEGEFLCKTSCFMMFYGEQTCKKP